MAYCFVIMAHCFMLIAHCVFLLICEREQLLAKTARAKSKAKSLRQFCSKPVCSYLSHWKYRRPSFKFASILYLHHELRCVTFDGMLQKAPSSVFNTFASQFVKVDNDIFHHNVSTGLSFVVLTNARIQTRPAGQHRSGRRMCKAGNHQTGLPIALKTLYSFVNRGPQTKVLSTPRSVASGVAAGPHSFRWLCAWLTGVMSLFFRVVQKIRSSNFNKGCWPTMQF